MRSPIFLIGYPSDIGGASSEAWHTIKLWRSRGVDVRLIPTWEAPPYWKQKADSLGCVTHEGVDVNALDKVPDLKGGLCVVFCNRRFLLVSDRFRSLGCRVIWVNCMTWTSAVEEMVGQRDGPFDAYVFQSCYQRDRLESELSEWGYAPDRGHLIRGAFDWRQFPYSPRPHEPGSPFVVGRISRAAPDKFHAETWAIYGNVKYRPLEARVLGWGPEVADKIGEPPQWAEVIEPGGEKARDFYQSIHCLFHATGGSRENWPRVGLEAMSAGVPIVAERAYGWPEMISSGVTGLLGHTPEEMSHQASLLANDEALRLRMAVNAREALEGHLATQGPLWAAWEALFDSL